MESSKRPPQATRSNSSSSANPTRRRNANSSRYGSIPEERASKKNADSLSDISDDEPSPTEDKQGAPDANDNNEQGELPRTHSRPALDANSERLSTTSIERELTLKDRQDVNY
jgi:hypothetical protein